MAHRETLQQAIDRIRAEEEYKSQRLTAARKRIQTITPDNTKAIDDPGHGHYGLVNSAIPVVDGRTDLKKALIQARGLIQDPRFAQVVVMRESPSLAQSVKFLTGSFYHKNFHQPSRGIVLPWPNKPSYLVYSPSIANMFGDYKQHSFGLNKLIGPDYHQVFQAVKGVFPEFLSWDIRSGQNRNPGGLHFDDAFENAIIDTREKLNAKPHIPHFWQLSKRFLAAAENVDFEVLPGSVTLTVSVRGGGSILIPNEDVNLPEQSFFDTDYRGVEVQDGDLVIIRGKGWPSEEHRPAYHCSQLHEGLRDVAVASSYASYLSPHVQSLYPMQG